MAVRGFSRRFDVLNGKGNDFAVSQWLFGDGDARSARSDVSGASQCDAWGCVTRSIDGRIVALVRDPQALQEDCARADVLETHLYTRGRCQGPEWILDGAHFAAHGATELRLQKDGSYAMRVARKQRQMRPWFPQRPQNFTRTPVARGEEMDDITDDPLLFAPD